ncbi:FAD-dependent thymidylate synthase [Deferrisoma camini]|uniref:FAD-dependent thymidylate synthase n=1 Tax=Deferrisoma camini TaxID=1035120 RepID=UPI00046CF6BA|nr:FAD-dependent thymidylate synthase [Deferrisoma camini]
MAAAVRLLSHTPDPERTVALAARLCYSARGVEGLARDLGPDEVGSLLDKLVSMGHFSALEHASFTFGVEGVSRACSHQLVRHRLASYSQQSQRYVRLDEPRVVVPPTVADDPEREARFRQAVEGVWALYRELVEAGVPAEDARYLLPNACETKLVVTMNARELRHVFALRLCRRAQWEIRDLVREMLRAVVPVAPRLFRGAGPGCLRGPCPEGEYSCGQAAEVRAELAPLLEGAHGG